jgi:hypothetical protein
MKTRYIIIASIILFGFLSSCDKLEEPFVKDDAFIWNGRKSIIFDITGQKCGNCPRAHETINNLVDKYGEAVIPIAIHATWYAKPATSDTSLPYHYDFRTDIGDYLGGRDFSTGFYGELYLPTGMVNSYAPEELSTQDKWTLALSEFLEKYPEFLIKIEGSHSENDSTISCEVEVTTNINNSRQLGLTVYVLEDHILQWQTDYTLDNQDVENYEHNHVLRAGMNGPFGEEIKTNTNQTNVGDIFEKSYSVSTKSDWVIENLLIVAFVHDLDTKEILQGEVFHFSE